MFTDKEIANLLNEVSETLAKSEKKAKLKKDDMPLDEEQGMEQPEMEQSPEQAPEMDEAPMDEQPEMDEAPMEEQPSEEIAEESEDAPLSDEELQQVYGSMEPEELERHFMIIRQSLSQVYGEEGSEQPEMEQPEMEAQPSEEENAFKSEFSIVKKENLELKKSISKLAKAIENMSPVRKSVTGSLTKSEDNGGETLTKSELTKKINEIVRKPTLSKSERQSINNFWLNGNDQEKVLEIIKSHGGK